MGFGPWFWPEDYCHKIEAGRNVTKYILGFSMNLSDLVFSHYFIWKNHHYPDTTVVNSTFVIELSRSISYRLNAQFSFSSTVPRDVMDKCWGFT